MKRVFPKRKKFCWPKLFVILFMALNLVVSGAVPGMAANSLLLNEDSAILSNPGPIGYLTENGSAAADIYISSTASELEVFAVKEFKDTIEKVSGAPVEQTADLTSETLHIVLGTPDSLPEITGLFQEDLDYLADSDGFAIRKTGNRIYIIGTEAKGVLNGVYDFLEENAGILWTRGVEELGTLYDFQPTISIIKVDYREKSPFDLRGWNACGQGSNGVHHVDAGTRYMEGRNKQNIRAGIVNKEIGNIFIDGRIATANGMLPFGPGTTLLIEKYFDEHPEYFMTNPDGTPKRSQYGSNLNFYSAEAADALALELVNYAQANKIKYVGHSIQDNQYFMMHNSEGVDMASLPFTADNGVTVNPGDKNYKSTVFFNFLNKVARKVKEQNSEIKVVSLAYIYCEYAPAVEIEDNIIIQFAPIYSDDHLPVETSASNTQVKKNLQDWAGLTKNIVVYNYYGCMQGTIYSRPIAKKVQADLQYYESLGLLGLTPEGLVDSSNPAYHTNATWNMNNLYFWLINKLFWDPYADLDALTADFCQKAYGDASEYMLEYYRLIQQGWDMFDDYVWYTSGGDTYIKKFIIDAGIAEAASAALENAYNTAGTLQKKRIEPIKLTFEEQLAKYENFENEDGKAYKTTLGKAALTSYENLNFEQGPWAEIIPLTVFKGTSMEDAPRDFEVRLMWDEDNLYIAYKVPNVNIGTENDPYLPERIPDLDASGTWWLGGPEFMETYIAGNMANMSEFSAYYTDARDQQIQYNAGVVFQKGPYEWESHSRVIADGAPEDRYWANILVIPFSTLNVTAESAKLGGTFIANIYGGESPYYGWCGSNVWSTAGFRLIEMVSGEPVETGTYRIQ